MRRRSERRIAILPSRWRHTVSSRALGDIVRATLRITHSEYRYPRILLRSLNEFGMIKC